MKSLLENTRRPDVTFHRSGRIDITARVSKGLSLACGDVIGVGREDGELYIYKRYDGRLVSGCHEAQLRSTNPGIRNGRNMRAYSKRLCRAVMGLAGVQDVLRVPVGDAVILADGRLAMPIIYMYKIVR